MAMDAGEENLKWLATNELEQKFTGPEDYKNWLEAGIKKIDGEFPLRAFSPGEYIIGFPHTDWMKELEIVYKALSREHQIYFGQALLGCLDTLEGEPEANDVWRNDGDNPENRATDYLRLCFQIELREVVLHFDEVRQKFPKSEVIFLHMQMARKALGLPFSTTLPIDSAETQSLTP